MRLIKRGDELLYVTLFFLELEIKKQGSFWFLVKQLGGGEIGNGSWSFPTALRTWTFVTR